MKDEDFSEVSTLEASQDVWGTVWSGKVWGLGFEVSGFGFMEVTQDALQIMRVDPKVLWGNHFP